MGMWGVNLSSALERPPKLTPCKFSVQIWATRPIRSAVCL